MQIDWSLVLMLAGSSLAAALVALWALGRFGPLQPRHGAALLSADGDSAVLIFDGERLVDATAAGRALLAAIPGRRPPWRRLVAFMSPRFPGFEAAMRELPQSGRFRLELGGTRPLAVLAECQGGLTRITLCDGRSDPLRTAIDPLSQAAQEEELELLRRLADHSPGPAWRERPDGAVIWANRAYLDLALPETGEGGELPWPLPTLFAAGSAGRQPALAPLDGAARWFDLARFPFGTDQLVVALPADAAVRAEASLRSFIQTLTKTFAHLRLGLAIFDRERTLALFNPALLELTGLSPEFLSSRPSFFSVLDAMRERRTIPEPKDYKSWRRDMAAAERAATTGEFEDTWTLPSGRTYRVTGRPHPDSAIAFLIEDITDEMTLTRRFRAELDLSQSVLDALEEAVAVFSAAGLLILSNTAYARLWGDDPAETLARTRIGEAAALWQARTAPDTLWSRVAEFVGSIGPRAAWAAETQLIDGRLLACRFAPIADGATLVGFCPRPVAEAAPTGPATRRSPARRRSA